MGLLKAIGIVVAAFVVATAVVIGVAMKRDSDDVEARDRNAREHYDRLTPEERAARRAEQDRDREAAASERDQEREQLQLAREMYAGGLESRLQAAGWDASVRVEGDRVRVVWSGCNQAIADGVRTEEREYLGRFKIAAVVCSDRRRSWTAEAF